MSVARITTYRVHFERLGRGHYDFDVLIEAIADDADALAEGIARYARTKLLSSYFFVGLDMDEGRGSIEAGRFGRFTFAEVGS